MMEEEQEHTYCLNCKTAFPDNTNQAQEFFCANCGQSSKDSRLSFGRLIKDAISNILNIDSRLIHTFRDLIFPSKLTRTYIEGKRKYYVNPVQLFIFTMLALITLSIYSIKFDNSAFGVDDFYGQVERSKLMEEYDSLVDTIDISGHEKIVDSIKSKLFNKVNQLDKDTLGAEGFQIFNFRSTKSFGISKYDALHLTQKELFEKYNITDFWDKINVGQYIRIITNPVGGIKHIVKNLTWAVFITVLFISFFMKLLYIRKSYYLVEHVVLVLNSHSLLFLLCGIYLSACIFIDFKDNDEIIEFILLLVMLFLIYLLQFRTLKKYYKQGFFKTAIKQIIINSAYLFIFLMSVFIVALISVILY
jgi:hypothetical protein